MPTGCYCREHTPRVAASIHLKVCCKGDVLRDVERARIVGVAVVPTGEAVATIGGGGDHGGGVRACGACRYGCGAHGGIGTLRGDGVPCGLHKVGEECPCGGIRALAAARDIYGDCR